MMEIFKCVVLLFSGLTFLIVSSDVFVEAASSLAIRLKVPKMIIALTIAEFGTCAPELAISFNSIASGNIDNRRIEKNLGLKVPILWLIFNKYSQIK